MSTINENQNLEYNILGCVIRIKSDEKNNTDATKAINLLNDEINALKLKSPHLKDIDVAVLSALNLATKSLEVDADYRENVFALKSGIEDALKYVEQVSSATDQAHP